MKRSLLHSVVLTPALVALPLGHMASASGARTRHTIVAALGAAAPAGGNYALFFNARLSARSEVAFDALLSAPGVGVFVGDGRTTSAIALGGNAAPAGENFGFVTNPFITRNGRVVFDVNGSGIFTSNRREIVPLVQNGDDAPGGGTVRPLVHATNEHGAIAYFAQVSDSTATQGIFRTDRTGTVPSPAMTSGHRREAASRPSTSRSPTIAGRWRSEPRWPGGPPTLASSAATGGT